MSGDGKGCYLTTTELHRLDLACAPLRSAFGSGVYLVGSAGERRDFRDVDVRAILHDDDFDRLFGSLAGAVVGVLLRRVALARLRYGAAGRLPGATHERSQREAPRPT